MSVPTFEYRNEQIVVSGCSAYPHGRHWKIGTLQPYEAENVCRALYRAHTLGQTDKAAEIKGALDV